jgi:signal peptidase I
MTQLENADVDSATALKCDLAAEVLRSFGALRFAATGWSMLPAVWPGDTLVVERVCGDQVRAGDIVLFGRQGRLCAHRVVATAGGGETRQWITQGDGMPVPDPPVAESELLGRVAYLIRAGRLLPAPAKLSVIERLVAKIVQRSTPAARALVYSQHVYVRRKSPTSSERTVPCPS